MLTNGQPNTML